jgi:DNA processing protein
VDKKKRSSNLTAQAVLFSFQNDSNKVYPTTSDVNIDKLLLSILAFSEIRGVGHKTLYSLFDRGVLPQIIDWQDDEILEKWKALGDGVPISICQTYLKNKSKLLESGTEAIESLKANMISFVPIGHQLYPNSLFRLSNPPRWLFVKGNANALSSPSIVAVIGTRSATLDGIRLSYYCSSLLAIRNIVVLSGLAPGIDISAHSGAVDSYGVTIAVLGFGINMLETNENQELVDEIIEMDGAIISEYLPSDQGTRNSFLRRNELQAALAKIVIPIECPKLESGTGATIRRALAIKTPIIGVSMTSHSIDDKKLITTRENLMTLGVKYFSLDNGQLTDFWNYLYSALPGHTWRGPDTERQSRFFRVIGKEVLQAKKQLRLDSNSMDRLAEYLKTLI